VVKRWLIRNSGHDDPAGPTSPSLNCPFWVLSRCDVPLSACTSDGGFGHLNRGLTAGIVFRAKRHELHLFHSSKIHSKGHFADYLSKLSGAST
jgi:hypothetical protein